MPMSEALLEARLNPAGGQMFGTFTEGQPIAEAIGHMFAIQVDGKAGERIRRYGRVSAVHDNLLNIDNLGKPNEQVVDTTLYFLEAEPLVIKWRAVAVAVAEIAEEREA